LQIQLFRIVCKTRFFHLSNERKSHNIHETGNKINYRAHTSVKFNYSGTLFFTFRISSIARPQGEFYCFVCERRIVSWIVFSRNPLLKDIGTGGFRLIILNACRKLASYVVKENPKAFYYSKYMKTIVMSLQLSKFNTADVSL